ncbi:hypothetical protein K488DRAFT_90903 [Vararia minispora EC-137]|uniref:Uncharacterized protein n=1 Tax=Vararia minispora EC-137 TaxID=1314806 RepID=A0ACB8Q6U0_9AGAM|nr:hypothetical protein K488DRAFT_90903 [Vararia minispora EC-137]
MVSFSSIRIVFYILLWLFSVILLGLSCSRIHYTTHLERTDPLHNGRPFYDPIVAELIATTILAILWAPFAVHAIWKRRERGLITSFAFEGVSLFVLWLMYLVGAAIATSIWGDLSFCRQFWQCRELTALVAFAWLSWITLFSLFSFAILIPARNNAWSAPMHGYYVPPRNSGVFTPQTAQYRA